MKNSSLSSALPVILLLLAMMTIQSGASLAKTIFPVTGPIFTTILRLFFASLILVFFSKIWKIKVSQSELKSFFYYGASLGLMNVFFYMAINRIPLGIAVGIEFCGPLAITVLFSRKKIDFLWIFLAAIGIFLILPAQGANESLDLLGVIFAFLAAFFWALYIYFGQKAGKSSNSLVASTYGMLFAFMIVLPFLFLVNFNFTLTGSLLMLGLLVGLLSSAIPYSLEMYALKRMPTKQFGVLLSLEPVFASLSGFIFLQEKLSVTQLIAMLLIVFASMGVTITGKKS